MNRGINVFAVIVMGVWISPIIPSKESLNLEELLLQPLQVRVLENSTSGIPEINDYSATLVHAIFDRPIYIKVLQSVSSSNRVSQKKNRNATFSLNSTQLNTTQSRIDILESVIPVAYTSSINGLISLMCDSGNIRFRWSSHSSIEESPDDTGYILRPSVLMSLTDAMMHTHGNLFMALHPNSQKYSELAGRVSFLLLEDVRKIDDLSNSPNSSLEKFHCHISHKFSQDLTKHKHTHKELYPTTTNSNINSSEEIAQWSVPKIFWEASLRSRFGSLRAKHIPLYLCNANGKKLLQTGDKYYDMHYKTRNLHVLPNVKSVIFRTSTKRISDSVHSHIKKLQSETNMQRSIRLADPLERRLYMSSESEKGDDCSTFRQSSRDNENDQIGFVEQMSGMGIQAIRRKDGNLMSLLELQSLTQMESETSKNVLEILIAMLVLPIAMQTAEEMEMKVGSSLDQNAQSLVGGEAPEPIARILASAASMNITNILEDAVAARAVPQITVGLSKIMTPLVINKVGNLLDKQLASTTANMITTTLSSRVTKEIPELLERVLIPDLVHILTRSLTHTLVPTLTLAITHDQHQDIFCRQCFDNQMYCNKCHYSASSLYYTNYYATYYSDFYSKYYADYYAQSAEHVDWVQNPPGKFVSHTSKPNTIKRNGETIDHKSIIPGRPIFLRSPKMKDIHWKAIAGGSENDRNPTNRIQPKQMPSH